MDEQMIDLAAGDARLRRRLEAYADARLSPDLVTSSRMRARVLAVAHRQADLARADAALTVVDGRGTALTPGVDRIAGRARSGGMRLRRPLAAMLAAALVVSGAAGTAFAAQAGGALYEPRVWIETLTLPSDPSARAVAELARLQARLQEADAATHNGDAIGTAAALTAYERIVESASAAAIAAQDEVAIAVLEAGVGRNVEVLRALLLEVPAGAAEAISRAVERAVAHAVERSQTAIDRIETRGQSQDAGGGNGGGAGPDEPTDPPAKPTKAPPTAQPTPKPTHAPPSDPGGAGDQGGSGGQGGPDEPDKTPKPHPTPKRTPGGPG